MDSNESRTGGPAAREREGDRTHTLPLDTGANPASGLFERFTQQLPGLAWIKDVDGRYVYANDAVCDVFGVPRHALYGLTDHELFPAWIADQFVRNDRTALGRPGGLKTVESLEHRDGTVHQSLVVKFPVPGPDGRPAYVGGMAVEITDRLRAERHLRIQYSVVQVLADGAGLVEAAPRLVQAICEGAGWDMGALWTLDDTGVLRCLDAWQAADAGVLQLEAATRQMCFAPGSGLPGRIWATARPTWIVDVIADRNFPRGPSAAADGVRSGFGFPIHGAGGVIGVLEFFSRRPQSPDEELLQLFDALGKQIGQFVERRSAEERLRRRERELSEFLENASVGIHWVDAEGRIIWANAAELQMLGYARDEYIGHAITEFHADGDCIREILARLARRETIHEYEARLRCRDGSIKHVLIDSNVLWDGDRFVHTRCFTRDITERRQWTDARERLAAIVDSSDDAIVSKTLDGIITSWNAAAERMFGYTAADAIGRHVSLITPDDRRAEQEGVLDRLRRGETIHHFETERRTKDGRRIHVSLSISPVRDEAGGIVGAAKVARDITQLKSALEALRRAEETARSLYEASEQAVRARDEFLSVASHELKNPINALQLQLVGVLRAAQSPGETPSREWVVDRIGQAAQDVTRLVHLVDNLLDVSRITAGRLELDLEEVELSSLVRAVAARFREQLGDRVLTLHLREAHGRWDRLRLEQVVTNLLSNAIKYGERRPMAIAVAPGDDHVTLAVTDTGIGIEPHAQGRLFKRFERAVSGRQHGGLGLGLWITREIVEAMGGTITVSSRPGQGSTFTVTLPSHAAGEAPV